jgi:hypothetical protein
MHARIHNQLQAHIYKNTVWYAVKLMKCKSSCIPSWHKNCKMQVHQEIFVRCLCCSTFVISLHLWQVPSGILPSWHLSLMCSILFWQVIIKQMRVCENWTQVMHTIREHATKWAIADTMEFALIKHVVVVINGVRQCLWTVAMNRQIQHGLTQVWNRASTVRGWWHNLIN